MRSNLIFFGFMMNDFWQKRIGKVDHRSSHAELLSGFSCFGSNTPVFTSTLKALNDLGLRSSPASSHTLSSSAPLHPHHMNLLSVPWPHIAGRFFIVWDTRANPTSIRNLKTHKYRGPNWWLPEEGWLEGGLKRVKEVKRYKTGYKINVMRM